MCTLMSSIECRHLCNQKKKKKVYVCNRFELPQVVRLVRDREGLLVRSPARPPVFSASSPALRGGRAGGAPAASRAVRRGRCGQAVAECLPWENTGSAVAAAVSVPSVTSPDTQ